MAKLKEILGELAQKLSETSDENIDIPRTYVKFADLTKKEKEQLRGKQGDVGPALKFSDLNYIQKEQLRGKDGKSLSFDDLTPEQKEQLRGRPGHAPSVEDVAKKAIVLIKEDPLLRNNLTLDQMEAQLDKRDRTLWNSLKALVAKAAQGQMRVIGGGMNRAEVLTIISGVGMTRADLSSQCDGVTKVFTLPESYKAGTLQLMSTQFPIIYRPTVDFTESADMEATLTSEVGAPQEGQTLVAIYEKTTE